MAGLLIKLAQGRIAGENPVVSRVRVRIHRTILWERGGGGCLCVLSVKTPYLSGDAMRQGALMWASVIRKVVRKEFK